MEDQSGITLEALDAFARRDYGGCVRLVASVFPNTTLLMIQLLLISLQRLGEEDSVRRFTDEHLPHLEKYPWEWKLVCLTLGLAPPEEVQGLATSAEQYAEYHSYWGSRLLTLGDVAGARREFTSCLRIEGRHIEQALARVQLEWPSQRADSTDPHLLVVRLSRKLVTLLAEGRLEDALPVATEAYEAATSGLAIEDPMRLTVMNNLVAVRRDVGGLDDAEMLCREGLSLYRPLALDNPEGVAGTYGLLSSILRQRGEVRESLEMASLAVELLRRSSPEDGATGLAGALMGLAEACTDAGDHEAATIHLNEALDVAMRHEGSGAPRTEAIRDRLVEHVVSHGTSEDAEALSRECLEIAEEIAESEDDPPVVRARARLAGVLDSRAAYDEAGELYRAILNSMARTEGSASFEYVVTARNFAKNRMLAGDDASADALLGEVVHGYAERGTADTHLYVRSLCEHAQMKLQMGNASVALELLRKAEAVNEAQTVDDNDPQRTEINRLIARAHRELGSHSAALPHLRRVVEGTRTATGNRSVEYVSALYKLGQTLIDLQKFDEAGRALQEALDVARDVQAGVEIEAKILNGLGVVAREQRDFEEADKRLSEALRLIEGAPDTVSSGAAGIAHNLLLTRHQRGDHEGALELLDRYRNVLDENETSSSIEGLLLLTAAAEGHWIAGEYQEAETQLQEVLNRSVGVWGPLDPQRLRALEALAVVRGAQGRATDALDALIQAEAIRDESIAEVTSTSTQRERVNYFKQLQFALAEVLTLVTTALTDSADSVQAAWELVTRRKAIGLEAFTIERVAHRDSSQPKAPASQTPGDIARLRSRLAEMEMIGPPVGDVEYQAYQAELKKTRAELSGLVETMASQRSDALRSAIRASARQIVAALPAQTVLVEFAKFSRIDFRGPIGEPENEPERYVAFVVDPRARSPRIVDLGPAGHIDFLVGAAHRATAAEVGAVSEVGSRREDDNASSVQDVPPDPADPWKELAEILAAPLTASLPNDVTRLVIIPDGELTQLPFAPLPNADGTQLADRYMINYLGASRDILRRGAVAVSTAPVVIGSPDYELHEELVDAPISTEVSSGDHAPVALVTRHVEIAVTSMRGVSELPEMTTTFDPLPTTRFEAETVAGLLGVSPWLGADAVKERVLALRSPRVLHLATHGFFLRNYWAELAAEIGWTVDLAAENAIGGRLQGGRLENPMLRSGLVLAGANTWLRFETPSPSAGTGLLTAEDIASMDLGGTELVVLSACDTGLGDIRHGEGVLGLQRGFAIAGARTVIMSMWKAPDLACSILMERFYEGLLRSGLACDDALSKAQSYVRRLTVDELRRRVVSDPSNAILAEFARELCEQPPDFCPFSNPAYWAGFISLGDWRALSSRN